MTAAGQCLELGNFSFKMLRVGFEQQRQWCELLLGAPHSRGRIKSGKLGERGNLGAEDEVAFLPFWCWGRCWLPAEVGAVIWAHPSGEKAPHGAQGQASGLFSFSSHPLPSPSPGVKRLFPLL